MSDNPDLADDLLDGADAIANFLGPGWNPRRVYHAASNHWFPIFRVGNRLTARKSKLRQRVEELERDAVSGA